MEVCTARQLLGEERLAEAAAEQAALRAVAQGPLLRDALGEERSRPTWTCITQSRPYTAGAGPPLPSLGLSPQDIGASFPVGKELSSLNPEAAHGALGGGQLSTLRRAPLPAFLMVTCLDLENDHPD